MKAFLIFLGSSVVFVFTAWLMELLKGKDALPVRTEESYEPLQPGDDPIYTRMLDDMRNRD